MSFYNPGTGGCGTATATQSIAAMPTTYAPHQQAAYNQAAPTYPYAQAPTTYNGQPTAYGGAAQGAHSAYQYGSSSGVAPGSAYDPYAGNHAMPSTMGNSAALAAYGGGGGGAAGWQPQTQYQDPAPMNSMMMQANSGMQHWGAQQAAGAMSATASLPTQQTVPHAQQPAQLQVQDTYSKGFIDGVAAVARSQYNWNQTQHGEMPQAAMFPTGGCGMPPGGGYYTGTTPPGGCAAPPNGCGMPAGGCGMPPGSMPPAQGGPYPAPGPCGSAPGGPVSPAATNPQNHQKPQARPNAGKYKATGNKRRTCC